LLLGR
jgi:hypothetical protein